MNAMKPDTPVGAVVEARGGPSKSKQSFKAWKPREITNRFLGRATCSRCGKSPSHDRQQCPARDAVCHKCAKRGHFQSVCRSTAKVGEVRLDSPEASLSDAFMRGLTQPGVNASSPWAVTLLLNGKLIQFEIDTSAEVTVISQQTHEEIGSPPLSSPQRTLRGPSNHVLPVIGQFTGKLGREGREVEQVIFVVKELRRHLLGRPAIETLDLAVRIGIVKGEERQSPINQFPSLFQGLGKLEGEYSIKLQEGAEPFTLTVPRRVAIPLMKQVKDELQRMEQLGVIARVSEPTEWCSGMVVVPKADNRVRICVDLTRLNQSVCRERHIMPAVEQILAQLAGARIFSKLDANSGFWQIPLSRESALLTTFITPFGRYCFHRLPFGITSAPEHFQRHMSDLLGDLDGVVCMVDDVLVHGRTASEHDERLVRVLERLKQAGLTLNQEKCRFSQTQVKFLGQVIDQSGIHPDPDKVEAIQKVLPPSNVGDIRRFLGMANHLSKFSPNLAEKTQPLRGLLNKANHWV